MQKTNIKHDASKNTRILGLERGDAAKGGTVPYRVEKEATLWEEAEDSGVRGRNLRKNDL